MLVEDLMSTDVVTCPYDTSLQTAVVKLLEANVGSVIVIGDGKPTGIVTETDSLHAGASLQQPFQEIPLERVVSQPLVTTTGDETVRKAVQRMKSNEIKKLPVVEDLELRGIITFTDVAAHHSEIIQEARELCAQRERWEGRKADIDEF